MFIHLDLLAVRKIPLKERPYLTDNATEPTEDWEASSGGTSSDSGKPTDPAVRKILTLIRKKVLSDRALHDQVSPGIHCCRVSRYVLGLGLLIHFSRW